MESTRSVNQNFREPGMERRSGALAVSLWLVFGAADSRRGGLLDLGHTHLIAMGDLTALARAVIARA